ncbi:hypothetical protein [Spirosoma foliorum]|uniref:Uncharacterized protein n=1 Tax=Spirosoma foliorum TaxID=2710596 RepID=A0A7G5GND0_9BACT|nr:hypothetical protein [Spirosoma foliorum]QMW00372.1 hypothetical protein H3H32_20405 [Spirosoma foliorum]
MNRSLLVVLLCFICFIEIPSHAQSVEEEEVTYKDFIIDSENVWLLTTNGILKQVNLNSGQLAKSTTTIDSMVVAITKDRKGAIVIGDTAHYLKQYNKQTNQWHDIGTYAGKLTGIIFDNQNRCLLVTKGGLVDPDKQQTYFPDNSYSGNKSIRFIKKGWVATPAYFIDSHDRLWLGFNYGEWGGDVFAFDANKRRFIQLKKDSIQLGLNPVFGFCEDPSNVYISGGVSHMFMTHGSILKVSDQTINSLLLSRDVETPVNVTTMQPDGTQKEGIMTTWRGGHRIGPVAYNPVDKCLYFFSQLGIHKGELTADLSDIKQWQNILTPELQGSGGQQFAAGPGMNVQKMVVTADGTLFFLADHEGLGIYKNNELRFVK